MHWVLCFSIICLLSSLAASQQPDEDESMYYSGSYEDFYNSFFESNMTEDARIQPADTTIAAIFGTIAVVGLTANGVVFFVIFCGNEISKTVTAMYVVQLALADSAFLITLPFFVMQQLSHNWNFGEATCIICNSIKFLNYYAGIFFLTAMSVDRYIAVAYSTKAAQLRTIKRTKIVCAISWTAAALMTLPILIYSGTEEVYNETKCRVMYPGYKKFDSEDMDNYGILDYNDTGIDYDSYEYGSEVPDLSNSSSDDKLNYDCAFRNEPASHSASLIVNFVLGFVIPLVVICVSYALILKQLRASEKKMANNIGNRTMNMRKRVTRMVAALVICFALCWLPYHILHLAKITGLDITRNACNKLEAFVIILAYSNSALNPILYSFLGHNFRDRLYDSLGKTRRRLSMGSRMIVSNNATRRSSQRRSVAKKARRVPDRQPESQACSGCEADFPPTVVTENHLLRDGRNVKYAIPMLEINRKESSNHDSWKHETELNDRSECVSRT